MNVQQIRNAAELRPLKLSNRETPHLTLEPNTTCNVRCARCYNLYQQTVKPLAQIEAEIDLGLARRNLETISILGGEPTLHPEIARVIALVKARGLVCELLTNGVTLLAPGGDALLERMLAAGLDRLILHIDSGQAHVHGDIEAARRTLMDRLEARRVYHALALTIYPGQEAELPALMRRHAGGRFFDGVLATLAMRPEEAAASPREADPGMLAAYRAISAGLGVEPAAYLPASNDDDTVTWLLYFYYLNAASGETFDVSPPLSRLFRATMRRLTGRHFFGATLPPALFAPTLAVTCLAELAVHPAKAARLLRMLAGARPGRGLRLQYIVLQQAPHLDAAGGEVGICYHCPDATIRNGELTPVCVADRINPLVEGAPVDEALRRTVYAHMRDP